MGPIHADASHSQPVRVPVSVDLRTLQDPQVPAGHWLKGAGYFMVLQRIPCSKYETLAGLRAEVAHLKNALC